MPDPFQFIVIAEAQADCDIATTLADRVITEESDCTSGMLTKRRTWRGIESGTPYTSWPRVKSLAMKKKDGVRIHPKRGEGKVHEARKAVLLAQRRLAGKGALDCILFVRDTDNVPDRSAAFKDVAGRYSQGIHTIVALPHPKREAWALAGFVPKNKREREAIEQEKKRLSFDPIRSPERLKSKDKGEDRDAKRVLRSLTGGDTIREEKCWTDTSLSVLKKNGAKSGLKEYLESVSGRLVPLFQR